MKFKSYLISGLSTTLCLFALSCSDKENPVDNKDNPQTYKISGKVEKGPFVSGSTITIQPLNEKMKVLGEYYNTTIQDNIGNFNLGSKQFQAPYAELTANGYFFNEITGDLSTGTLSLRALVDLSDETTVNVNILTHLKYQRIKSLVASGKSFKEANGQAQKELFTAFGLQKYAETDASRFSITAGTDESAVLIAISSLLLVDRSEAELTEYLAKLCKEFGQNGTFTEESKAQIKEDRENLYGLLSTIEDNIIYRYKESGLTVEVKEIARFLDWNDDGTAGNEMLQEGQEVVLETTQLDVPNKGGKYDIKITSPIPVYLTSLIGSDIITSTPPEEIYKDVAIDITKSLDKDVLTIQIGALNFGNPKSTFINLYDCLGNVIATVTINQAANENLPSSPMLGAYARTEVEKIASFLGEGLAKLSLIEQYYHYNKQTNWVSTYISSENATLEESWSAFYYANRINVTLKHKDAQQQNHYQEILNVFSAMYYYNMVVYWGGVPYLTELSQFEGFSFPRTDANVILDDLIEKLKSAIGVLEEKKNESLEDTNSFFFVSKDVARILLADIYMYQGKYTEAEPLLSQVINNGFYELDATDYSDPNSIGDGNSKEAIFIAQHKTYPRTRAEQIKLYIPAIVSLLNYTDVVLSYAECLYKTGQSAQAKNFLNQVASAKGITVDDNDVFKGIKDARNRLMLYSFSNFAFLKRNSIAKEEYDVKDYRLLLPIPMSEMQSNSQIMQNPGY